MESRRSLFSDEKLSPERRMGRVRQLQQHRGPAMIGLDRFAPGRVEEVPGSGYRNDDQHADPDKESNDMSWHTTGRNSRGMFQPLFRCGGELPAETLSADFSPLYGATRAVADALQRAAPAA